MSNLRNALWGNAIRTSSLFGLCVGCALVVVLTVLLVPLRASLAATSPALVLVLPALTAGVIGGRVPAAATGFVSAGALSFVFIPPYNSYKIAGTDDVVALGVFLVVALAGGTLAAREAARRRSAELRAEEFRALHERYEVVVEERERLATEANRVALMERVDEQRSALLRSVSHDLRTPLATIRAVTTDLRAGASFDPATQDDLLELVADEAERLDRIVENLLNMSRIEAGALQPDRQAVAIDELVVDRVQRLTRLFEGATVCASFPDDLPYVDADYVQLDLVVTNLLENASRHSPPGTEVRVGALLQGDYVQISVSDQGPGIAIDDRCAVFEPFSTGKGSRSSGVGLAICRAIVEAHGGSIWADENEGGGARVVFTVPVRHD